MKWSSDITIKVYLLTQLRALPNIVYGYYVVIAGIFGVAYGGHSLLGWFIRAATFFVLLLALYIVLTLRRLRKMRRLTGTNIMKYEITSDSLKVHAGKDMVALPTSELTIWRVGKRYVVLRRKRTKLGILVLHFDDELTKHQALNALTNVGGV